MTRIARPSSLAGAVAGAAAVALLGSVPSAGAAPQRYDFLAVCGPGFVQKSAVLVDSNRSLGGRHARGLLSLSYEAATGTWCATNLRTKESTVGERRRMSVTITGPRGRRDHDTGRFGYYAGPVKIKAPANACIRVSGVTAAKATRSIAPFTGVLRHQCG